MFYDTETIDDKRTDDSCDPPNTVKGMPFVLNHYHNTELRNAANASAMCLVGVHYYKRYNNSIVIPIEYNNCSIIGREYHNENLSLAAAN